MKHENPPRRDGCSCSPPSHVTRVNEFLAECRGSLPVWIRAPKKGTEFYTGLSRAKLYEGASRGHFRSVSIREPGQTKGTRLFDLRSILDWIAHCEQRNSEGRVA